MHNRNSIDEFQEGLHNVVFQFFIFSLNSNELEYLKELLRDAEITRPEHVDYYMDYHNIINLMS